MVVIRSNQSFVSQILRIIGPLGETFDFLSHLGFDIQLDYGLETSRNELHSVIASKRYLNENNLIHGHEAAMILNFRAQNFRTHI